MKKLHTFIFLACFPLFAVAEETPPNVNPEPTESTSSSDTNMIGFVLVGVIAAILIAQTSSEEVMEVPLVDNDECFLKLGSNPTNC